MENYVIWAQYSSTNSGYYICNMSGSNQPTLISNFGQTDSDLGMCMINNGYVAFSVIENSNVNLKLYNIASTQIFNVADTTNNEINPVIQGNFVFYSTYNAGTEGQGKVKGFNISTSTTFDVQSIGSNEAIMAQTNQNNDDYVVMMKFSFDTSGIAYSILVYDISAQSITVVDQTERAPLIVSNCLSEDGVLVYSKYDEDTMYDVYSYDINTSQGVAICTDDDIQAIARIKDKG